MKIQTKKKPKNKIKKINLDDVLVVIPAFNEEKSISDVIDSLNKEGYYNIVVINDASVDDTSKIAYNKGVVVLDHIINRGLGGALKTGLDYAKLIKAKVAITFDADGQHCAKDIKKMVLPLFNNQADAVIGSRLINPKGMPLIRRIGNSGLNVITYFLFHIWTTDSQSGLRAFSRKAIKKIKIKTNKMEVSSEFLSEIKRNKLRFKEVPIKAIYSKYSMEKGQSSLNAFNIVLKLIIRRIMR